MQMSKQDRLAIMREIDKLKSKEKKLKPGSDEWTEVTKDIQKLQRKIALAAAKPNNP